MAARNAAVRDFLGTLDYLMGLCSLAQQSEDTTELFAALPYVESKLSEAKGPLERIDLFKLADATLSQFGKLVAAEKLWDADRLILSLAIIISELSGANDSIRRQFPRPPAKKAK